MANLLYGHTQTHRLTITRGKRLELGTDQKKPLTGLILTGILGKLVTQFSIRLAVPTSKHDDGKNESSRIWCLHFGERSEPLYERRELVVHGSGTKRELRGCSRGSTTVWLNCECCAKDAITWSLQNKSGVCPISLYTKFKRTRPQTAKQTTSSWT